MNLVFKAFLLQRIANREFSPSRDKQKEGLADPENFRNLNHNKLFFLCENKRESLVAQEGMCSELPIR